MTPASAARCWQWKDGAFSACESVPITDRGFRYGMSVFESVRVEHRAAQFLDQHIARLIQACGERGFAIDESILRDTAALFTDDAPAFARIYVTAGDGLPTAPAASPRVFVFIEDRIPPDADAAWEISIHDETCHALFGGLKTANYWFNVDALTRARAARFDETLLFNDRAELVSACCANVFLVRDGQLATPARSSGARAGVVREWIMNRRKVAERRLRREDVVRADEIFLTNSWIGVIPVATLEGRPLGPRSIGARLASEFAARTG